MSEKEAEKKENLKFENVEVDRAEDKPKYTKWGTLDKLEELTTECLLQLSVGLFMEKTNRKELAKEAIPPMEKLKRVSKELVLMNGSIVLKFLQKLDPTIKGWRCLPTEEKSEKKEEKKSG